MYVPKKILKMGPNTTVFRLRDLRQYFRCLNGQQFINESLYL